MDEQEKVISETPEKAEDEVRIELSFTKGETPEPNKDESGTKPSSIDDEEKNSPTKEDEELDDEEKNSPTKEDDEQKKTEKPLLDDETMELQTVSDDAPTLKLPYKKKKKVQEKTDKSIASKLWYPITNMKKAWNTSNNIFEFVIKAVCIVFATLGWFICVGGIPFISLAMLIVGCIFVDDCPLEPKIPVYLIVAGLLGTLQHFISVWTKYVPKNPKGFIEKYRRNCLFIDALMQLFLIIWFISGCVWVYSNYEPDYDYPFKKEYCHKTVYLFAFWILNLSFIILAIMIVFSLCCVLCITRNPKESQKVVTVE